MLNMHHIRVEGIKKRYTSHTHPPAHAAHSHRQPQGRRSKRTMGNPMRKTYLKGAETGSF